MEWLLSPANPYHLHFPDAAGKMLALMIDLERKTGSIFAKQSFFSERLKISISYVEKLIAQFRVVGIIEKVIRRKSNKYLLNHEIFRRGTRKVDRFVSQPVPDFVASKPVAKESPAKEPIAQAQTARQHKDSNMAEIWKAGRKTAESTPEQQNAMVEKMAEELARMQAEQSRLQAEAEEAIKNIAPEVKEAVTETAREVKKDFTQDRFNKPSFPAYLLAVIARLKQLGIEAHREIVTEIARERYFYWSN